LFGTLFVLALVLVSSVLFERRLAHNPDILRAKQVAVVDDRGVVRARLGGNLPDPVMNGKTVPRGQNVAGILIYDDTGQERGGYVTFSPNGVAALTLDTRSKMVALFAADPDDGATAKLSRGNDWVEMRSGDDGTQLSVGRNGALVVQEPPMSQADATALCTALKSELGKLKPQLQTQEMLSACDQRMPDSACRKCIGLRY
jgi:hypothetical protein